MTGLGAVSALGNDARSNWTACRAGRSGIGVISRFDATGYRTQIAGEVKGFRLPPSLSERDARKMAPFMHYVIGAALEAVQDAHLEFHGDLAEESGICLGVGVGGLSAIYAGARTLLEKGPNRNSPMVLPMSISNMAAGHLSALLNLRGYSACVASACASSTHALGDAARRIAHGDARVMLAGGTEDSVNELSIDGFGAMRALSIRNHDASRASRPFDVERDGFVLGEGAAVLVLEEFEHACQRGARIYCELAGYGTSSDAHHMTVPSVEGPARAMERALHDAGCGPEDVNHVNAHATSTPTGDANELRALRQVFGARLPHVAVSATKSMTGHLLGAAGALEAVFTACAVYDEFVPPTINLDHPDEAAQGILLPTQSTAWPIDVALSSSFGFGGTNAVLAFRRLQRA